MQIEVFTLGFNTSGYPGAFTPKMDRLVRSLIYGRVLHLFSGQSYIGDERIDIEHPNATINCDVADFIEKDKQGWDWIVLDPPYAIASSAKKLQAYGKYSSFYANVPLRRKFKAYCQEHTKNVLWLDVCAPMIEGFERRKLWLCLPGGFHTVRVLSWLEVIQCA